MTFNEGAIPLATIALLYGFILWKYRLRLVEASDRFRRRDRSHEDREKLARLAWMPVAFGVVIASVALFAPLWE